MGIGLAYIGAKVFKPKREERLGAPEMKKILRDRVLHAEYARLSSDYDRRWATYLASTHGPLFRCLGRERCRPFRILDVGCGTGALLHELSRLGAAEQFVGVDASAAMLGVARGRLGPDVALCEAHAALLPFPAQAFDCAISSSVFHYLREPLAALRENFRVLQPGGRLLLADWCADFWSTRLATEFLRRTRRPVHHVYRSTGLAALCAQAGFVQISVSQYRASWPWGMLQLEARRPDA